MSSSLRFVSAALIIAALMVRARAGIASGAGQEKIEMRNWISRHLFSLGNEVPFSFTYAGKRSKEFLASWDHQANVRSRIGPLVETVTFTDPATALEVKCISRPYFDFAAVEWTVYLTNKGKTDTPIIENLQALDTEFERRGGAEFLLHHNVGSPASKSDYQPLETRLVPNSTKRISAAGGRPTNSDLSYFNLAGGNQGTIIVVGWPGQWSAGFVRDGGDKVHVVAGQELTHFRLHPGEQVRTPLIVLMDWSGDWIDGQNDWRRWMMAYGMPKPGGALPKPMFLASSSRAYQEMIGANEANQIMHLDRYREVGLKLDYWWMDAGWYVQKKGWPQVGTWEVDKARFPHGFKAISDHAHAQGVKTLVWFEPERVAADTWLSNSHPEWLLNPLGSLATRRSKKLGSNEPCVVFNTGAHALSWNGITWPSHGLSFHPGPNGEYSVVRYRAAETGEHKLDCVFSGIDEKTTTDVHVLHGPKQVFGGWINLNGHGKTARFGGTVWLTAGEALDFVVGWGNGTYFYDSTGVGATIIGPRGDKHDIAAEFGKQPWSYGYLAPSDTPDSKTFHEYDLEGKGGGDTQLLDLGNPAAWKWLVNHVDKLLTDNGIDLYRQDFNMDPLEFWRTNDAPDRQGITEIKHVTGYLAFWDELRRRHPNMLIDSCASGGRRNDLETMRRAVPLWRSDYAYEPIGHQCMTYGISMWLPYFGTGTVATTDAPYYGGGVTPIQPYAFWSNTTPSLGCGIDVREPGIDYAALRRLVGDWRSIGEFYYGDFYPLTPYSQANDTWIAWQFNRPDSGEGMVQAFRRDKASASGAVLKFHGLDPLATYKIKVLEGQGSSGLADRTWTGAGLMNDGLPITLEMQPAAAVITYARVKQP